MIKRWWKRLWCIHDWECISNIWGCTASDVKFRCTKCGKVEGL